MKGSTFESLHGLNVVMSGARVAPVETQKFTGNARLRRHSESLPNLDLPNDNHKNPINPFFQNLCRGPCSEEETIEEGKSLLGNFIVDEISKEVATPEKLRQELAICTPQGYAHPEWAKVGMELRRYADDFMKSKEREKVKKKANKIVALGEEGEVTWQQFRDLTSELLDDGITKERIVVLFFFCADVAIASLKETEETNTNLCRRFIEWSLQFVVEKICSWVQRHGGWGAVFGTFYQKAGKIAAVVGVGLICYIGYKKFVK